MSTSTDYRRVSTTVVVEDQEGCGCNLERSKTKIALTVIQLALTVTSIALCKFERGNMSPDNDQFKSLEALYVFNICKLPFELTYFVRAGDDLTHCMQGGVPFVFAALGAAFTPRIGSISNTTLGFSLVSNFTSMLYTGYHCFSRNSFRKSCCK